MLANGKNTFSSDYAVISILSHYKELQSFYSQHLAETQQYFLASGRVSPWRCDAIKSLPQKRLGGIDRSMTTLRGAENNGNNP